VAADGSISDRPAQPIAADFRLESGKEGWTSPEAYRESLVAAGTAPETIHQNIQAYTARLSLMKLKVIAGILGLPLSRLTQRDRAHQLALAQRRARILRRWLMAVGLLFIVAIGVGVIAWRERQAAIQQRDLADRARRSAEALAVQQKQHADLLAANIVPLAYHSLLTSSDFELHGLATSFLANTKTVFIPAYDPSSFQKSYTAAMLCQLIATSEIQSDSELMLRAIKGAPLTEASQQRVQTALLYARQMEDILHRLSIEPNLDARLNAIRLTKDNFEKVNSEALLAIGGALLYSRDYEGCIVALKQFTSSMDSWNPPEGLTAMKYFDLFEACSNLAHAYRLTQRRELAMEQAHKAMENGEHLAKADASKMTVFVLRCLAFDYFRLLGPEDEDRLAQHTKTVGLTERDIADLHELLDGGDPELSR
jgi:hypothetical protein